MTSSDEDLRDRFAELREEQRTHAPSFGSVRTRAKRVPSRPTRLLSSLAAAASLALIAYGAVHVLGRSEENVPPAVAALSPVQAMLASARWTGPTDFLLDVPGASLLRTVPTFGRALPPIVPLSALPDGRPRDSVRHDTGA
jgi:hypothetical protein